MTDQDVAFEDQVVDILLVEDNPDDVELALLALEEHNVANRIHVVRDGVEALDFIFNRGAYENQRSNEGLKLILLDLKLPLLDGLEVLREIKSDTRTRRIPVVMMTSSDEESDRLRSYDLGVNSYIVKPVDFEQFTETMRSLGYYWLLLNARPPARPAEPPPDRP